MSYKAPENPEEQPLTEKQEKLARMRVKHPTETMRKIAKRAGYEGKGHGIVRNTWNTLNKPHVKARVKELMDASPKLAVPNLLKKLEEGLNAKDTKFFQHNGEVTDERQTVDHVTRHKYLETALELHGVKERTDAGVVNNFFTKDAIEAFVAAFKRRPEDNVNNP